MILLLVFVYFGVWQVSGSLSTEEKTNIETELKLFGVFPYLPNVLTWAENAKCRNDSLLLMENLRKQTTWAMQMLDASTKDPVGVFRGNTFRLGNFDECVDIQSPIQGQYCLARVTLTRPGQPPVDPNVDPSDPAASIWNMIRFSSDQRRIRRDSVHWALCVPASCSHTDVQTSLAEFLATPPLKDNQTHVTVDVNPALCQTKRQDWDLSADTIAYCIVIGLILLAVALSTVVDVWCIDEDHEKTGVLAYFLCFSLKRNIPDLSVTEKSDSSIDCIYGMKFISMCLVVICHHYGLYGASPTYDSEKFESYYVRKIAVIFFHGDIYVDTFFTVSGLLATYVLLNSLEKRPVNPLQAIFFRYVRLTPAYAVVVFFFTSLLYQLGDGPTWELLMAADRDACRENWWLNLLYVNNYVRSENLCMLQSWYLPCDTHLFMFAVLVITLCHKYPKTGCTIVTVVGAISVAVPALITYYGNLPPLLYFTLVFLQSPRTHEFFLKMYMTTHIRASPYFVGMAAGYILFKTTKSSKKYTWQSTLGVVLSLALCISIFLPTTHFYDPHWRYDALEAAAYASLFRVVWAVGISLLIISISFSKTSMIGSMLAWPPLKVLSNLVYSMYLVHMGLQTYNAAQMRVPFHSSDLNNVREVIADLVSTVTIAFVLYLAVEAPVRQMFRHIFRKKAK